MLNSRRAPPCLFAVQGYKMQKTSIPDYVTLASRHDNCGRLEYKLVRCLRVRNCRIGAATVQSYMSGTGLLSVLLPCKV